MYGRVDRSGAREGKKSLRNNKQVCVNIVLCLVLIIIAASHSLHHHLGASKPSNCRTPTFATLVLPCDEPETTARSADENVSLLILGNPKEGQGVSEGSRAAVNNDHHHSNAASAAAPGA